MRSITTGDRCGSRSRQQHSRVTGPEHHAQAAQASAPSRNVCQNQLPRPFTPVQAPSFLNRRRDHRRRRHRVRHQARQRMDSHN
jgi:hypothetical protein